MPAFRISVDDDVMATVNTDGYDLVAVSIGGNRNCEQRAILDVAAGRYPAGAPSSYLIFVPELQLAAGQHVTIAMLEDGVTGPAGRTIDELFPDGAGEAAAAGFDVTDDMVAEAAQGPHFHDSYAFEFTGGDGGKQALRTPPGDDVFTFNLLWDSMTRPSRARVSLSSNNFDHVRAREGGHQHVQAELAIGQQLSLKIL